MLLVRLTDVALVALGAGLGGALRYTLGGWLLARSSGTFPWHTMAINVSGAFLIGLLAALAIDGSALSGSWKPFLGAGVLGGYTTFSTLALESTVLVEQGAVWGAALNMVVTGTLGLAAAAAGLVLGRML